MMKYLINLMILLVITFSLNSCMDADEIRERERLEAGPIIVKAEKPAHLGSINKINVNDFKMAISKKSGTLVDVRTPEEYAEGHLEGAVNVNFKKRTFPDYINAIDKTKPVLIYCRSANRSGKAALIMQSLGFTDIIDLDKGFKAWKAANEEIVTTENNANKELQNLLSTAELKGRSTVGKSHQIGVDEFQKLISESDVTLVDVRTPKEFAEGHVEGSINIDWKNRHFAENILKVTNDKPVAIYCRSGNRATRAMYAMGAIGFNEVYNLNKGFKSWKAADKPIHTLEVKGDHLHLDAANFNNAILGLVGTLIDVRTPKEYDDFHIPNALNVDYKNSNFETEFAKIDKSTPVLIYCRTGIRSRKAGKIITGMGYEVYNLEKGVKNWKSKGLPLEGKNINKKDSGEEGC